MATEARLSDFWLRLCAPNGRIPRSRNHTAYREAVAVSQPGRRC